jgi:xylulokinase
MNELASKVPVGSEGLLFHPFGNGAERILENRQTGATMTNLQFNIHRTEHLCRAAQEGIVFALYYGLRIMNEMGIKPTMIRAGEANMFLSPVFREAFATVTETPLELYDTDGSQGAARGAAVGAGYYSGFQEAFQKLEKRMTVLPNNKLISNYKDAYGRWLEHLIK